jgi:biopolymer transport protein ExbD
MAINFRRRTDDEPEINLIAFIDVLLVVLIFLVLSTTYSKVTQLRISLPVANAESQKTYANEVNVGIGRNGDVAINGKILSNPRVAAVALALKEAAGGNAQTVVILSADALSTHQSVISVLDAARQSGLAKITFASKSETVTPSAP